MLQGVNDTRGPILEGVVSVNIIKNTLSLSTIETSLTLIQFPTAKSHWTFFVVHFIPDHEFFVRSELAPTVRPLSCFKEKPARAKRGQFANFFKGFKIKKFRFSDFSWWFEDSSYVCAKFGVSSSSRISQSVTHAAVYIWDSPSARWGLRPQAPIWVLANFGDKRNSSKKSLDLFCSSLHSCKGIFRQIEASSDGSPAIGLQRIACKGKKGSVREFFLRGSKVKNSGFQTFPGGLKIPATCVQNLVFPALLEVVSQSVTHAAVYIWDSPSARWGLRPQAPIWVLANFGDKLRAKSHWTFFVVHFIPDHEFFVRSKLAPTVRPLSGFKEKPARAKRGQFANFFEGFKSKKFRFSDFSWWFEDSSYVCAKFGVSSTSRSGLEFVSPISESVSQLHMRLYIYGTRLRLAGGYAPRPPFGCWLISGISVIR
ncbi:hypothetical protein J6590_075716 [Homalodisca vitripennis]|nr:hypothetical protein J6590_075716 [Homalodisca vitripennis]